MKELRELENLIVAEYSKLYEREVSTLEASVVGAVQGVLFGIILNNPKALKDLENHIENRKAKQK